jgi:ASC-1-like (ASCH) protein
MITHQMKLSKIPFAKIVAGTKVIESRLFDDKRKLINIGDIIEFIENEDSTKKITLKVKALYRYGTFSELFSDFNPVLFGGESKESLLVEIEQFYSYEDQNKFGVVGIKIEK